VQTKVKNFIFQTIINFFDVKIREHQAEFETWAGTAKEFEPPTEYVHAFLGEMRRRTESGDSHHHFSIAQLQNMCLDLWLAGQETTSTTVAWGIAYMLHRPDTMIPLYEELDRVIGSSRLVTLSDRPNLPYTCAVVQETLRIANILVNAIVSNRTTRDVQVRGVLIREGTPVLPQISALLYDDVVFERPKEFDPARWIDRDGALKKVEEFAPFSLGKR
jgi:cytochrome P450 family 33